MRNEEKVNSEKDGKKEKENSEEEVGTKRIVIRKDRCLNMEKGKVLIYCCRNRIQ
jgi:hypothetical protein